MFSLCSVYVQCKSFALTTDLLLPLTTTLGGNVTVNPGNETAHEGDWKTLRDETAWIRDVESGEGAVAQQPFFFYQGMALNISVYIRSMFSV